MQPLPIDDFLPQIDGLLRVGRNLVLVAEPGAGKTTRVPPALLPLLDQSGHRNLVMLQPRRVAARAAAGRIAEERGWAVGREVGYHIRFDRVIGKDTRLRVLTEGILTRQLLEDPFLEGVGCVVLDEFHERSVHIDLAIALLREVQQTVRPDLRLVVMSATLDAEPIAAFLGGAPIIRVPGRLFPIQIEHQPGRHDRDLEDRVADVLHGLLQKPDDDRGDILVFLPGAGEIERTKIAMQRVAQEHNLLALPLHGSLPNDQQLRALQPAAQRKLILSTNIAETSLTIDGVTVVIDAGLHRMAGYDARRGMDMLTLEPISQASATQRAGRAGRTRPGRAIRLWSAKEHHELPEFDAPELARVDLAGTVLALHAWGCDDPRRFAFFQPPPEHMLASAERLLAMLGALDAPQNGKITLLGRRMLAVPAHPRVARLLLAAADAGEPGLGASIAALLSEKDILRESRDFEQRRLGPLTTADSDLDVRLELLADRKRDDRLDLAALFRVREVASALARQGGTAKIRAPERDQSHAPARHSGRETGGGRESVCEIDSTKPDSLPPNPSLGTGRGRQNSSARIYPLLAYPDRVCRMRNREQRTGTMVGGGGVKLSFESAVTDADLFVAIDARHNPSAARAESIVRIAGKIQREWLEQFFSQSIRRERSAVFDEAKQRVIGVSRVWYLDLLIDEQPNVPVDDDTAADVLAAALVPRAANLIHNDDRAAALLARLDLLRQHMPEHPWPTLEGEDLKQIVRDACRGKRSAGDVAAGALVEAIRSRLAYPLDRLLDQHAPETIQVPTGNRIRVVYTPGQRPKLPVRLQELFGQPQTPRIANGRLPVTLELLGPNYRPVQVTDDLASFWKNTYPLVRKDLRARYPKHSWPEDPLSAPPQAKGRPHRT